MIPKHAPLQNRGVPRAPTYPSRIEEVEFGHHFTPNALTMDYAGGEWRSAVIEPVRTLELHPAATVFHYAQEIFEGIKAFRQANGDVAIFRLDRHVARFNRSARRLQMPPVDEAFFAEAIKALVRVEANQVPPSPGSLYIRPVLFGVERLLKVSTSREFKLVVLAMVAGPYFKGTTGRDPGSVKVFVSRSVCRTAPGGLGSIKAGANYAGTLPVTAWAAEHLGCGQVLFLDARERKYVEEMGGMNILFVRDGQLVTPPLTKGTILDGVTRDCVRVIAENELRVPFVEDDLALADLLKGLRTGTITEAIACGTAASVTGIGSFLVERDLEKASKDEQVEVVASPSPVPGPITSRLFRSIRAIQYGEAPDPYGWMHPVRAAVRAEAGPV
jgi:branched-chain amino acid aminotransferase